ncbi:hypothetical protein TSAR_007831 [Trichomalopsis sarcophagae]|uniref:Reverse transcriptase Ty1/copia-type domain-containing protein n=1 Tax=Trichomalopsis sarcophagae TaxID=543379 RepID=A0A232EDW9_9HYME|nr:hypothetical protein TSAR_007831 [Trichomalopsis sarcophagae]
MSNGPVVWSSKRQKLVTLSTTEAEYVAASTAARELVWLRQLLSEIGRPCEIPTDLFVDNQGAIRLAKNVEFHKRSKHINVKYHFLRERQGFGEVSVQYVPTNLQLADGLTKPLPRDKFKYMCSELGIRDCIEQKAEVLNKNVPENQADADLKNGPISRKILPTENTRTAVENFEFPYESETINPEVQDLPTIPFNPNKHKSKRNTIFKLPARAKVPVRIPATEDSVKGQAYLRLIKTIPGVCIGEAAVTNEKGFCYAMAINIREDPVKFRRISKHLEDFDLSEHDDFLDFPLEGAVPENAEDRVKFIMEKVRKTHHKRHELR